MFKNTYTNTGNFGAVTGLILTTLALSYISANSTKIVDGAVAIGKSWSRKAEAMAHQQKKQYAVVGRDFDGNFYDTGKRIWK
jgi:hypothetical protein